MLDEIWWLLCVGLGGLALMFVIILLYRTSGGILRLKAYPATCDLIDYGMMLEENIILLKSGGLMSMYKIDLPDLSLQPQSKLNHIYDVVQQSLLQLEGNYCVHVDLVRNQHKSYEPFLEIYHPVLSDLEGQRAKLFAKDGCFGSELYLTITYIGDPKTSSYVEDMILPDASSANLQIVKNFKQACSNVILSLQQCLSVRPLTTKQISQDNVSLEFQLPQIPQDNIAQPQTQSLLLPKSQAQEPGIQPKIPYAAWNPWLAPTDTPAAPHAVLTQGATSTPDTTSSIESTDATASTDFTNADYNYMPALNQHSDPAAKSAQDRDKATALASTALETAKLAATANLLPQDTDDALSPPHALNSTECTSKAIANSPCDNLISAKSTTNEVPKLQGDTEPKLESRSESEHELAHEQGPEPAPKYRPEHKLVSKYGHEYKYEYAQSLGSQQQNDAQIEAETAHVNKHKLAYEAHADAKTLTLTPHSPLVPNINLAVTLEEEKVKQAEQNLTKKQVQAQAQALAQAQAELSQSLGVNPEIKHAYAELTEQTTFATSIFPSNETGPQDAPDSADTTSPLLIKMHEGLSFLQTCLSGEWKAVSAPKTLAFIDALLSYADYHHGSIPKLGDKYICVIALDGLPEASAQGMLNKLAQLSFNYRFSTRFVYFSTQQSQFLLERFHRYWSQRARTIISQFLNLAQFRQNRNAEDKRSALDDAKKSLENHEIVFGSYTANLVLMHSDIKQLKENANEAMKLIETLGFGARIETVNTTEAFLGSLPGHYYENLRRAVVSQDVLADLLPISSPSRGEKYAPNPLYGMYKSPLMQVRSTGMGSYYLNLHDQDLGNTIVIGPPGSGKSVFLGELMLNLLRYRNMRVFAFDKDYSFYALTKALGGRHIELNGQLPSLCPLQHLHRSSDVDYALSFLNTLYALSNTTVSLTEQDELAQAIKLFEQNKFDHDLSSFSLLLSSPNLRQGLAPFINSPEQLSIIDGNDNLTATGFFTTFECGELFKTHPLLSILVLKQLFHLIECRFDGSPAAIVLDEAWLMLQHPVFADEMVRWIKTLRKFNVLVILATQTLNDLEISNHYNNLLECAKTRVYLANYAASSLPVAQYYSQLGLSPQEIFALSRAHAKRDYFFVKGNQHIMFKLMLSEDELNLLSITGAHNKAKVDYLYAKYGPKFYHYVA